MTTKSLGNSCYSAGNRVFLSTWKDGKKIIRLVSWSQKRCKICQRFLSLKQIKYCDRCADKVHREQSIKSSKENYPKHFSKHRLRNLVYRHADTINIGDIV